LISDAQTQAQNMANAAGATLGPIVAMSSSAVNITPSYALATVSTFVGLLGSSSTYAPPCTMTVTFRLLSF
jgi:uncharacterized protein YggE